MKLFLSLVLIVLLVLIYLAWRQYTSPVSRAIRRREQRIKDLSVTYLEMGFSLIESRVRAEMELDREARTLELELSRAAKESWKLRL